MARGTVGIKKIDARRLMKVAGVIVLLALMVVAVSALWTISQRLVDKIG